MRKCIWMAGVLLACAIASQAQATNNPPYWISPEATTPPARYGAAMAYDAAHR